MNPMWNDRKRGWGKRDIRSAAGACFLLGSIMLLLSWHAGCVAVPKEGGGTAAVESGVLTQREYIGSAACRECHEEIGQRWEKTLHARMMQDPKENPDAILGDFEQSLPFEKDDIIYTIGNHWTQRYITDIDGEYYVLPRMWSIQSREWVPYSIFSWKKKPWRVFCAGCHTTGFDHETGTFAERSITCEACHGPGSRHAEAPSQAGLIVNPSKLSKERSLMICESCHVRGRDNSNPDYCFPLHYKPGDDLAKTYTPLDIKENEDVARSLHRIYDEWKERVSQPEGTSCELCQNFRAPNKTMKENAHESGDKLICHTCHSMAEKQKDHSRHPSEVVCTDCHLPSFAKSGDSQDIHSHRFQFKTPSKYLAYESCYENKVEESCSACHSGKSINWAINTITKWNIKPFKKFHKVGD